MNRTFVVLLAAAAMSFAASPASAAGRCRPHHGEHVLARSTAATVLARLSPSRQTVVGCSRRTGRRRTIDVLPRDGSHKLIGLRLAGTRVTYVMTTSWGVTPVVDDAVHDDVHHTLLDDWPFDLNDDRVLSWTVDAAGDVAFIMRGDAPDGVTSLVLWRRDLGARLVDARAVLTGVHLHDGTLRWRRNGVPHALGLSKIARSKCGPGPGVGTLSVDVRPFHGFCLRSTGVWTQWASFWSILDANGPYVVFRWVTNSPRGTTLIDLTTGRTIELSSDSPFVADDPGPVSDALVTDRGSAAWILQGQLWVRDAAGTRMVPGTGTGPLLRDGSTVTWSGGGPTVTLNP